MSSTSITVEAHWYKSSEEHYNRNHWLSFCETTAKSWLAIRLAWRASPLLVAGSLRWQCSRPSWHR